jgi:hypothetical protein
MIYRKVGKLKRAGELMVIARKAMRVRAVDRT